MAEGNNEETPITTTTKTAVPQPPIAAAAAATADAPEGVSGSWWGSWINSAKAKTSTVFEAVKKDLDELSTAVRTEASNVGAAIESSLKFDEETSPVGTVKKSLSTFFGQVTEALVPSLDDDEVEAVLITHEGSVTLTGFPKHLADLQQNEKTYLEEPVEELAGKYKRWLEVIEQDQFTQDQLNKHLATSEILNEKYLSLVPDKVPHMEFWKRYLFKRALLEDAIANADLAEKRAKTEINSEKTTSPRKTIIQTEQPKLTCTENDLPNENLITNEKDNLKNLDNDTINDEINWESEGIPSNIELSEEEQIRLLEEYEQEIQEREKRKSLVLNEDTSQKSTTQSTVVVQNNHLMKKQQLPSKKTGQSPIKTQIKTDLKKNSKEMRNNSKITTNEKQSPKKNEKQQSPNQQPKQQQQQQQQKQIAKQSEDKQKEKIMKSTLKVQKDHFNKEENASSTSDESWEKDFDLDE